MWTDGGGGAGGGGPLALKLRETFSREPSPSRSGQSRGLRIVTSLSNIICTVNGDSENNSEGNFKSGF